MISSKNLLLCARSETDPLLFAATNQEAHIIEAWHYGVRVDDDLDKQRWLQAIRGDTDLLGARTYTCYNHPMINRKNKSPIELTS